MKNTAIINSLKKVLKNFDKVAAAYLFGSAAENETIVNDLDILVLLYPGADRNPAWFYLYESVKKALPKAPKPDILFFDLQTADPEVLYEAVNKGILLKNESPDLLTTSIEQLSGYFLENEFMIQRAAQLRKEALEEFYGDRQL